MKEEEKKRLAIYCFYDPDGIVDRYVEYYLKEMSRVAERTVIVVNGSLSSSGKEKLTKFTDEIIVRENNGFDICGYKTALEWVGWDVLGEYYEVILSNNTLFGPVYPFQEMFSKMDKIGELDFWGITRCLRVNANPHGNPYGYIPEHVQSFFTVYRNSFLKSEELKSYWDRLPEINSYADAIGKHESYFTKYFSDLGFRWDSYVDNRAEADFSEYLLMTAPKKAMQEYRCPVFKRKTFFQGYDFSLCSSMGESAIELLRFLKEKTDYDTDMIFENIIRTCNMMNVIYNLGLFHVLPDDVLMNDSFGKLRQKECALIMHIYYLDMIEEAVHYAASMPQGADIYITTPFEKQKSEIEKAFSQLKNHVEVRIIENRGRDVSALLVGCADVIQNYEYICFWHDKKSRQVKPESVVSSWSCKLSQSVLASETYVQNVIETFRKNPFLGFLSPLPPTHGPYFSLHDGEWGPNFENAKSLAEKLSIHVPMEQDIPPIAPLGTVFWFRGNALRPLADYGWKYSDFPKEPNAIDGTILHALERLYGYAAQAAGYLCGYLTTNKLAALEMASYMQYWRSYRKIGEVGQAWGSEIAVREVLEFRYNYVNSLEEQVRDLGREIHKLIPQTSLKTQLRLRLKRWAPPWLYSAAVRVKRFFFGPHHAGYSDDENLWEKGMV